MLERKGLGIRFGAAVIDGIIIAILSTIAVIALGVTVGTIVAALIYIAYPGIEVLKAASPGKMALKLKVVSEDGAPATRDQLIQRAVVRWLPTYAGGALSLLGLASPGLSFLGSLALFGLSIALLVLSWKTLQATRQGYWDVRAKTAVVGPAAAVPAGFPVGAAPAAGQVPPPPPPAV